MKYMTSSPSPEKFGELLKKLRLEKELSQRSLGSLANVTHSLIAALENGKRIAGPKVALQLADALALTGEMRAMFLLHAKTTSSLKRISVREELKRGSQANHWAKFTKIFDFIFPTDPLKELLLLDQGTYDISLRSTMGKMFGVIFRPGMVLLVSNPGLDDSLCDLEGFRELLNKLPNYANSLDITQFKERAACLPVPFKVEVFSAIR